MSAPLLVVVVARERLALTLARNSDTNEDLLTLKHILSSLTKILKVSRRG